ncbi:MAG: VanZ family protein [Dehalococcoidia bacterium]
MMATARIHPHNLARITTLFWIGLLLFLAALPRLPYVPFIPTHSLSSLAHFATHLMLAALVYLAVARSLSLGKRARVAMTAFLFSAALGLAIEGVQAFLPGRDATRSDFLYASSGALAGAASAFALDYLRLSRRYLSVAAFSAAIFLMLVTGASVLAWNPDLPRVGDHWHARYQISVCGSVLPDLEGVRGGVHSHGNGFIHIHPFERREAGRNANLALFFATHGGALTDHSLTLPSGETYSNGDRCPNGGAGQLVVTVNGERVENPGAHVLRNLDTILIQFRATDRGQKRLEASYTNSA